MARRAYELPGVVIIMAPESISWAGGTTCGLLSAIGGAAASIVVWALSESEPLERQMVYFSSFVLLLSALPLPWVWAFPLTREVPAFCCLGILMTAGQCFFAAAFRVAPGDKINTWSYMQIVFASVIGVLVWGEPVLVATVVGAVLVVAGAHLSTTPSRCIAHD